MDPETNGVTENAPVEPTDVETDSSQEDDGSVEVELPQTDDSEETNAPDGNGQDAESATVTDGAQGTDASDVETQPKEKTGYTENEIKSMGGKIQALQRELDESKKASKVLEALNNAALSDEEFKNLANRKLAEAGLIPSDSVSDQGSDVAPTGAALSSADQEALEYSRRMKAQAEQNDREFFDKFEQERPDLMEGSADEITMKRKAITAAAAILVRSGKPREEAYADAYLQVLHPEKLVERGQVKGLARSQSTSVSVGESAGQAAPRSNTVRLDASQQRTAKAFGMSNEEYADWLQNGDSKFDE